MIRIFALLALGSAVVYAVPVAAQESAAQSLYGVKEIVVNPVHFDSPNLAKSCRLTSDDLDATIMEELKDNGLPVVAEKDARPTVAEVPRIILVPQIVAYNSQGMDCITWVSMTAETRNHLRVLPIEIPRILNVVYWRWGELVASAVSVHNEHVDASLHNMIHDLAQHYTQAQPPTVGRPNTPAPH